jgi:hypothetical protein
MGQREAAFPGEGKVYKKGSYSLFANALLKRQNVLRHAGRHFLLGRIENVKNSLTSKYFLT